ncbi:MAG TPA: caspase family protein [Polyangia bacterium]|jgi:hypothetical protein
MTVRGLARLLGVAAALAAATAVAAPPAAVRVSPGTDVFAIIIGHNDGGGVLPDLKYADDDALRFYRLMRQLTPRDQIALFTELDVDTWRQIQASGEEAPLALPPLKGRINEVFALFKRRIAQHRQKTGRPVTLFFFYSGHGERGYFFLKKTGSRLADSVYTGLDLERAFADSPADVNQIFIDACKSQSLFTVKGAAEDDELGPDFGRLIDRMERAARREANLGIITSTQSEQPAGEARDLRAGYFSHVVVSGLTGAADADGDGVVQFREMAAFVSLYTKRLSGQQPWFHAPRGRLDQTLLDLRGRQDVLVFPAGLGGHFLVLDGGGRTIRAELHKPFGRKARLLVPRGRLQVVRIDAPDRGWAADVTVGASAVELRMAAFNREVGLGPGRARRGAAAQPASAASQPASQPLGDAGGAPGEDDLSALAWYDATRSGFGEPLSPQAVDLLEAGFGAGQARLDLGARSRHALFAGYGWAAPPVTGAVFGQQVVLGYRMLLRSNVALGVRGGFAFSSHPATDSRESFRLSRTLVEGTAHYLIPFGRRLDLLLGGGLGWQVAFVTSTSRGLDRGTMIWGDAAGLRAGAEAALRVRLRGRSAVVLDAAMAVNVLRDCPSTACASTTAHAFAEPQVTLLLEQGL